MTYNLNAFNLFILIHYQHCAFPLPQKIIVSFFEREKQCTRMIFKNKIQKLFTTF